MSKEIIEKLLRVLDIMEYKAKKMNVKGVAVAALLEDENSIDWITEMRVMGVTKSINEDGTGWNFIAIAFSKAAEMMDSHQNSGSSTRKHLVGELGFVGGATEKYNQGYIVMAFSGAASEEDLEISQYAIAEFKNM